MEDKKENTTPKLEQSSTMQHTGPQKIACPCGASISIKNISTHEKTEKHKNAMARIELNKTSASSGHVNSLPTSKLSRRQGLSQEEKKRVCEEIRLDIAQQSYRADMPGLQSSYRTSSQQSYPNKEDNERLTKGEVCDSPIDEVNGISSLPIREMLIEIYDSLEQLHDKIDVLLGVDCDSEAETSEKSGSEAVPVSNSTSGAGTNESKKKESSDQ